MHRYMVGRLLQGLVSLAVVSAIIFVLVRSSGDPVAMLLPVEATPEDYVMMRARLGLDKPLPVQYVVFIGQAVQGDFGHSYRHREPAIDVVLSRYPATLELVGASMLVSLLIALPIGVYSAARRGGWLDSVGKLVAILGQSLPPFWLGIMLILLFGVWLRVLPVSGRAGLLTLIMPAVTLGWYVAAGIMRLTRSSMLEVLDAEYVKLARIKGLPERTVIWKHAFKNAALPVLTYTAILFVGMLAGSVVTESVFAWPGVGRLMIDSVVLRDFPVIQAGVLMLSSMFIFANLVVDILYGFLDPRIRYSR